MTGRVHCWRRSRQRVPDRFSGMSAYWPVPWHFMAKVDLGNDIHCVEETRRSQPVRPVSYRSSRLHQISSGARMARPFRSMSLWSKLPLCILLRNGPKASPSIPCAPGPAGSSVRLEHKTRRHRHMMFRRSVRDCCVAILPIWWNSTSYRCRVHTARRNGRLPMV